MNYSNKKSDEKQIIIAPAIDGFKPFKQVIENEYNGKQLNYGEILIFFANLHFDKDKYEMTCNIVRESCTEQTTIKGYVESLKNKLVSLYGDLISDLIMMNTLNECEHKFIKESSVKKYCESILEQLESLSSMAETFATAAQMFGTDRGNVVISMMVDAGIGAFHHSVNYGVISGLLKGEYYLLPYYVVSNSLAALELDLVQTFQNHKHIKKCENCGKFFIPSSRSDEIYCDNIYRNGKTCKQIGYENKINGDEILKEYRKIYKTQNARKQRNRKSSHRIDLYFSQWATFAKSQLDLCQEGKITIQALRDRISKDDWMNGGIRNGDDSEAGK